MFQFRGGKLPAQPARPHLRLSAALSTVAAPPPASCDWQSDSITWPMYANDQWGDCTCAEIGHQVNQFTFYGSGTEVQPTEADVLGVYSAVTGFNPKKPSTDQGAYIQDVLAYWRKSGIAGHKIVAYAAVDVSNLTEVKQAISLFGSLNVGLNFPNTAMDQFNAGEVWDVVKGARNEGGHCVMAGSYGDGRIGIVTWGAEAEMTEAFWRKYCVSPETRVLTHDLRWIPASDVQAGDRLLAFDEEARDASQEGYKRRGRVFRGAYVESAKLIEQPCYDLVFDDGTKVRCSADHKWLVGGAQGAKWMETERLSVRTNQASRVIKPLDVWGTDESREAGYLAAAFDGEGCLTQRDLGGQTNGVTGTSLVFSQRDNAMLAETERCLKELGFDFGHSPGQREVHRLTLNGGRSEILRFLGSIRPHRLMERFQADRLGLINHQTVRLVSKTFVGMQPVVALTTDAKTYFAEGLASHNCDEAWVVLDEDGLNRAGAYFAGSPTFFALGEQFAALTGEPNPVPQPVIPIPVPSPPPSPAPSPVPAVDPRLVQARALMDEWAHDNGVA